MIKISLLFLFTCISAYPATVSVCASGCTYTSLQSAWDAVSNGDVIEMKAGETFTANSVLTGKQNITIRTTNWVLLPPDGYRISSTDSPNMPILTNSTSEPTIRIGYEVNVIAQNGIDISANTITFEAAFNTQSALGEGVQVMCADFGFAMPVPLTNSAIYYVLNWNAGSKTGQLSLTPGGSAIDITTTGNAADPSFYARPYCTRSANPVRGLRLIGLRFVDGPSSNPVIRVGGNSLPAQNRGSSFVLSHCFMEGVAGNLDKPVNGIVITDSYGVVIRDSVIRDQVNTLGGETHAISTSNASSIRVEGNYLSATGIGLLSGGSETPAQDHNYNLVVIGNLSEKSGDMHYYEGSGAPSGSCYYGGGSGSFYRDTAPMPNTCANSACYTCQANHTWALNTLAVYRTTSGTVKNNLEIKDLVGGRIEGNIFRGQPQSNDSGQGWSAGMSIITGLGGPEGWARGYNVIWTNNLAQQNRAGWYFRISSYAPSVYTGLPMQNVSLVNNVQENLSQWPETGRSNYTYTDGIQPAAFLISTPDSGITIARNTVRGVNRFGYLYNQGSGWSPLVFSPATSLNNLVQTEVAPGTVIVAGDLVSILVDGAAANCSSANFVALGTLTYNADTYYAPMGSFWGVDLTSGTCAGIATNPLKSTSDPLWVSATNSRLQSSSPYSAQNSMATHLASDGADMGANVDEVEQLTTPADTGRPSYAAQLGLLPLRSGDRTSVNIRVRDSIGSCTTTLWSSPARNAGVQVGTSTNSTGSFTFNSLTATSTYYYKITCGGLYWSSSI